MSALARWTSMGASCALARDGPRTLAMATAPKIGARRMMIVLIMVVLASLFRLLAREPTLRRHVGLEELQQLVRDLPTPRVARMGAVVVAQVLAPVDHPVGLARCLAVGPEIRPPQEKRRLHFTLRQ